jgi:hypothetical protein
LKPRLTRCLLATYVVISAAAPALAAEVPTPSASKTPPPYSQIEYVSEGSPYGPVSQAVRGRFHRLVLIRAAIVHDHPTLRLETLTYGDEGCCVKLVEARVLDLELLTQHGIELPDAARADFSFLRWTSTRSLEFTYGPLKCRVARIGEPKSEVECAR